eukprot:GEMP01016476.1.p1 GENE.GEMP01016476.1~~GEMP01016476.1.p1  ORF type:complete len:451 (+),score=78.28 GEMP01016476.1:118-1470(+)
MSQPQVYVHVLCVGLREDIICFLNVGDVVRLASASKDLLDTVHTSAPRFWKQRCIEQFGTACLQFALYLEYSDFYLLYRNMCRVMKNQGTPTRCQKTSLKYREGFFVNGHAGAIYHGLPDGEELQGVQLQADGSWKQLWSDNAPNFAEFSDIVPLTHQRWAGVNSEVVMRDGQKIPIPGAGRLFIEHVVDLLFLVTDDQVLAFTTSGLLTQEYAISVPPLPANATDTNADATEERTAALYCRWLYGKRMLVYRDKTSTLYMFTSRTGQPHATIRTRHKVLFADVSHATVASLEEDNVIHVYSQTAACELKTWRLGNSILVEVKCYDQDILALSVNLLRDGSTSNIVNVWRNGMDADERNASVASYDVGAVCVYLEGRHGPNGFIEVVVEREGKTGFSLLWLGACDESDAGAALLGLWQRWDNVIPNFRCDLRDCVLTVGDDDCISWDWIF